MVGIHRKLKAADVRFGTSWDGLDEAKGFCQWLLAFRAVHSTQGGVCGRQETGAAGRPNFGGLVLGCIEANH